jgi:hypothetical protein
MHLRSFEDTFGLLARRLPEMQHGSLYLGTIKGVTPMTYLGTDRQPEALAEMIGSFERSISLDALAGVIDATMRRFEGGESPPQRTESDQWLAPRLHAALRLTKREAATPEIWGFLGAYAFPDYVVWRWGRDSQRNRTFNYDVKKHAFKRLWWAAEMFRNGADYATVAAALARSDVANTLLGVRIMNNRAVAHGLVRFMDRNQLTSRQVNDVSTQLTTTSVTVALDSACPNQAESVELDYDWINSQPDVELTIESPKGPRHGFVSEDEIQRADETLERVIDLGRVQVYRKPDRGVQGEAEALSS